MRSEAAVIKPSEYTWWFCRADTQTQGTEGFIFKAKRLDIDSDTYQNCSINNTTRKARGIAGTVNFNEDDQLPETSKMNELFQSSAPTSKNIADRQIIWEEVFDFRGNFWCQGGNFKSQRSEFQIF